MSLDENLIEYNKKLQEKLNVEIGKVKQGASNKNLVQLQSILQELKASEKKRGLKLYFPHIIIDSWDYSDELSVDLMKLYRMYNKLK